MHVYTGRRVKHSAVQLTRDSSNKKNIEMFQSWTKFGLSGPFNNPEQARKAEYVGSFFTPMFFHPSIERSKLNCPPPPGSVCSFPKLALEEENNKMLAREFKIEETAALALGGKC